MDCTPIFHYKGIYPSLIIGMLTGGVILRIYNFSEVIGNTNTVSLIKQALKTNSLPQVSIFYGIPGTGKSTCAEIAGLSLTCDNPIDGSPCLRCRSCVENLKALQTTGESMNLVKKNLGKLNSREDVLDMIKEIFILKTSIGNNVYILEEFHNLSSQHQTAFLEEIDRLDKNTHIIICTTKLYSVIKELRSRGTRFKFHYLEGGEQKLLFDRVCQKLGLTKVSTSVANMIMSYSRGVPRDMTNLIEFIHNCKPTETQIAEFLGHIDTSVFTQLFIAMTTSMQETVRSMDILLNQYTCDELTEHLKGYVLDVLFLLTTGNKCEFSKDEIQFLENNVSITQISRICELVEKVKSYEITNNDFKFLVIRIRQVMAKKTMKSILTENSQNASVQQIRAKEANRELNDIKEEVKETTRKSEESKLMDFFGKQ